MADLARGAARGRLTGERGRPEWWGPRRAESHERRITRQRLRGIRYPEQINRVAERDQELREVCRSRVTQAITSLVVDATGVGHPILDAFREASLEPTGILITGGDMSSPDGDIHRVPKRELAATLQVALQAKRLKIAEDLPLADTLLRETKGFRVKISTSGHARFGNDVGDSAWREADHDDLVLATALAVWILERPTPGSRRYAHT